MAKMIFERIWRTTMIVINTIMNILIIAVMFAAVFGMAHSSDVEQISQGIGLLIIVNIFDLIIRKHIRNY